jgi:branched-chain amino acid transport system substrate-binding protein
MSQRRSRFGLLALLSIVMLVLAACGGGDEPETLPETPDEEQETGAATDEEPTGDPITVGIITSTSGFLSTYGKNYVEGLEAGLDFATDGTGAVDGRPIEFEIVDDGGEPDQAVSAAVDFIGQGVTIIAGTVSSGVAVQLGPLAEENNVLYISGPAASDAITGMNANTFRSGRQTFQDVATATTLLEDIEGADVVVLAQDTEFGQANVSAVENVLGGEGANVDSVLVSLDTREFTPAAQQVIDRDPDLLFVAWAGETTGAMWGALDTQGVFEETTVTTGLGDRATWEFFGPAAPEILFLAHYFPEAPDNEVNDFLLEHEAVTQADIFTPDGFVAAQMIVQAIREAGPDDVEGMIAALEGWSFDAPKGQQTIRAGDHAMLQPMFTASLDEDFQAETVSTLDPDETAPSETE